MRIKTFYPPWYTYLMIKACIFDVGGVLHKSGLFPPENEDLSNFPVTDAEFQSSYRNKEVTQIVQSLKQQKYLVAVLSNTIAPHVEYLRQRGIYDDFSIEIFSNEVHFRKPDFRIYLLTLERLQVAPEEAVFIDDLAENVEGATQLGINGIIFKSAEQLQRDLLQLGVTIN
ncbi:hypothetical protein BH11PAT1_BH11PAT1_7420 [soil metagenome]